MSLEIEKQYKMTYVEQCIYLQKKYGIPQHDYFATPSCKSKCKTITRTAEGLFIHHMAEAIKGTGGNLGQPQMAQRNPYVYQMKENLIYCNYLEHLLLHLKMNALSKDSFGYPYEIKRFFNSLGFYWICQDINDLFDNDGSEQEWRNHCYMKIKEMYDDYIKILKSALCFIEQNYTGEKHLSVVKDARLYFDDKVMEAILVGASCTDNKFYYTVSEVDEKNNIAHIIFDNGVKFKMSLSELQRRNDYSLFMEEEIRIMACNSEGKMSDKRIELLHQPFTEEELLLAKYLKDGISEVTLIRRNE